MKLEIMGVGKLRDKHYKALMDDYMKRLGRYLPSAETCLRESKLTARDRPAGLAEEAEAFRKKCGPNTIKVIMDERGKTWTSVEMARQIEGWMTRGERHVAFFIGSATGLDASLRDEADVTLALSTMTLPHEMARVFLAEQLYRSMTIIRGEPYHK